MLMNQYSFIAFLTLQDHTYSIQASPRKLRQQVWSAQNNLKRARRNLYDFRRRELRSKRKVKSLLQKLKKQKLIFDACEEKLKTYDG